MSVEARVGNVGETSKSKLDFEGICLALFLFKTPVMRSECMQVGRYVGRQAGSPSNHFVWHELNDYYSPTTATDTAFFSFFFFFVRAFDLLFAVGM